MSRSDITRPRNVRIGAMAAPLLIVGVMVLFNGASDPRSSAADVQAPPDPEVIIRPPMGNLTDSQKAAILFREQIPELDASDSPFPLSVVRSTDLPDDPGLDLPVIKPKIDRPEFVVTAMLGGKSGTIALINGRAQRVGSALEGGWVIKEIDSSTKQVVLEDGQGERVTLCLKK